MSMYYPGSSVYYPGVCVLSRSTYQPGVISIQEYLLLDQVCTHILHDIFLIYFMHSVS